MFIKFSPLSLFLILSPTSYSTAFIPSTYLSSTKKWNLQSKTKEQPTKSFKPSSSLHVSIGLGPGGEKVERDSTDKMVYEEPDHELYRKSRLSKFDEKCDSWYSTLLGNNESEKKLGLGKISENALECLLTPVELKDEEKLPPDHPQYTAYVRKLRQPWMPIVPAFGCENFGIPVVRRMAEAWRHFDVLGMVETDYSQTPTDYGTDMVLDEATTEEYKSRLEAQKVWIDSSSCSARLVYINGRFCPSLSITNSISQNVTPEGLSNTRDDIINYLNRLPDGFTDELAGETDEIVKECGTDVLSQLSAPHHNTGPATSQFAINNQQGMACFAALNSVRAGSVALIDLPENHEEELPIQILNVITNDGGLSSGDGVDGKGVAFHPRTLIVGEKFSKASIIQNTVDLDAEDKFTPSTPSKFHNGYTQVFLAENATLTHSYIEESGGMPVANVEVSGQEYDEAREMESKRSAIRDTHLASIDVHLQSDFSNYKGTIMGLGGCGRSKIAMTTTILKPDAYAEINGMSLSGGDQTVDMRTTIHHIAHGTTSRQTQKNMVGGRATATFKGRIRVEQSAQQTDSEQLARTLLLSDMAKIWAIPSLEIIADDVSCTHGATISDLSEEEMFYLRSRGLDRTLSRNMLMYAFVDEIGKRVDNNFLRVDGGLKDRIVARLERLAPLGDRAIKGEFSSV